MDEPREEETPRQRSIRYWAPRVVAGLIGFGALFAGLWDAGRSSISFLADWSTFVIQAGAIYLFVFEREFLANLVLDFLDFVERMKAWRAHRAAEREARRTAAKSEPVSPPGKVATQETATDGNADAPPPTAPRPVIATPPPAVEPRPRFRSRDAAFGGRAAFGIAFVALLGVLIWNPFGAGSPNAGQSPVTASTPSVTPTESAPLPSPQVSDPPIAWTYSVRDGDSCMGLGQRAHPDDARQALVFCEMLQRENPNVQLRPLRSRIRPGDELSVPADIPRSALETN